MDQKNLKKVDWIILNAPSANEYCLRDWITVQVQRKWRSRYSIAEFIVSAPFEHYKRLMFRHIHLKGIAFFPFLLFAEEWMVSLHFRWRFYSEQHSQRPRAFFSTFTLYTKSTQINCRLYFEHNLIFESNSFYVLKFCCFFNELIAHFNWPNYRSYFDDFDWNVTDVNEHEKFPCEKKNDFNAKREMETSSNESLENHQMQTKRFNFELFRWITFFSVFFLQFFCCMDNYVYALFCP